MGKINSNYNYSYTIIRDTLDSVKATLETVDSALSTIDDAITSINTALGGKQDKLIAGTGISIGEDGKTISAGQDYDNLSNKPILNQDLDNAEFVPVANTYYRHTGASATTYTIGAIYYYDGTNFNLVGATASGGDKLYFHNFVIASYSGSLIANIRFKLLTKDSTAYSFSSLSDLLNLKTDNVIMYLNSIVNNAPVLLASISIISSLNKFSIMYLYINNGSFTTGSAEINSENFANFTITDTVTEL